MTPAQAVSEARRRSPVDFDSLVHAIVVLLVVIAATVYAAINPANQEASSSVWFVYSAAIGYAAGRSGARTVPRLPAEEPPHA